MKDSCGFCAPFSVEDAAEIISPKPSHKVNVVENVANGGAKQLEVILEKEEDNDKQDDTEETTEERDDNIVERQYIKKNHQVETSPVSPMGSIASVSGMKDKDLHKELDFDVDPSELYLLLQRRDWNGAMQRLKVCPEEATHWISRKEADGKLRWRLLPIHGAIIFCAPDTMIKCLLEAYPECVSAKDDQGMLPLHLCYRMGSPAPVIEVLLSAFPESLEVKDRKGRTPIVMAQTAKGPNRAVFLRTIEKAQQAALSPKAVPASPTASVSSTPPPPSPTKTTSPAVEVAVEVALARQQAQYKAQFEALKEEHMEAVAAMKKDAEDAKVGLEKEVSNLKADLAASEEASQVLSEHVATLERRLKQEEETETHLATKIAQLDASLKATLKEKAEMEKALLTEKDDLTNKGVGLEKSLEYFKGEKEKLEQCLSEMKAQHEKDYKDLEKKYIKQGKELESLQRDYEGVSSNVGILDEQLKKKIQTEQQLVQQVSSLARQLTLATEDNERATNDFTKGIGALQKERDLLRATVSELSKKLIKVVHALEGMTKKQEDIAAKAQAHEKEIADSASVHSDIVAEVKSQQALYSQAKAERAQLVELLRQQELALARAEEERAQMMHAMEKHSWQLELSGRTRQEIVEGASSLKTQLQDVLENVTCDLPCDLNSDDDKFVDQVIKTILTKHEHDDDDKDSERRNDESEPREVLQSGDETYSLYVPKTRFNLNTENALDTSAEKEKKKKESISSEGDKTEVSFHDEKKEETYAPCL